MIKNLISKRGHCIGDLNLSSCADFQSGCDWTFIKLCSNAEIELRHGGDHWIIVANRRQPPNRLAVTNRIELQKWFSPTAIGRRWLSSNPISFYAVLYNICSYGVVSAPDNGFDWMGSDSKGWATAFSIKLDHNTC